MPPIARPVEPNKPVQPEKTTEPTAAAEAAEPNKTVPQPEVTTTAEPNQTETAEIKKFHDKCAPILSEFVDSKGYVNYKELKRQSKKLDTLLEDFANLDRKKYESWPENDKIAFWINLYNIKMLDIICRNYPIKSSRLSRILYGDPESIRHIPPSEKIGSTKWDNYKLIAMAEQFTLSEIEQQYFIKKFDDPRIFLALTQASVSGPGLRNKPYCGDNLDEQLSEQIKIFLSSRLAFDINHESKSVYLSALLQRSWYGRYFTSRYDTDKKFKDKRKDIRAVLNFITNYLSKEDVRFLETESFNIGYINYNWRLNDNSEK